MDILKDITNKSSIDPINKVDARLKENEKYKESTIGDSSSVREEKYKQKHIYIWINCIKTSKQFSAIKLIAENYRI